MNGFRIIYNVLTKSRFYMVTLLDELTTNGFPSCDVDDEEANATSTREWIYLPPRYVPLLLNPANYMNEKSGNCFNLQ